MKTDFTTLENLASYTINHLKQSNVIEFPIERRVELIDALATELAVSFSTDDDIRQQAIEEVEDKFGMANVPDDITETEMFNHARKDIIKSFNGEHIAGLYLTESLNSVAKRVTSFLMVCDIVEDVFGADEELITFLVDRIRKFNPRPKVPGQAQLA